MPYEIHALKRGSRTFVIRGNGISLRGEVWRGRIENLYWPVKALESAIHRSNLRDFYRVEAPPRFAGASNEGVSCRYIVLTPLGPGVQSVLKFEGTVPESLVLDWQAAIGPPEGTLNHEEHRRTQQALDVDEGRQHLDGRPGRKAPARRNVGVRKRKVTRKAKAKK